MSALRRSEDLLSLKTRRIVIQNEDSSYPPAGAVLAMDSTGRGGTVLTQDLSLNSIALLGDASAGILTYSDVSGLLLNSAPIVSLPTPVPFDSVPDSATLPELIESYNHLLSVLNGKLIISKVLQLAFSCFEQFSHIIRVVICHVSILLKCNV
jgi:hypothetical protein